MRFIPLVLIVSITLAGCATAPPNAMPDAIRPEAQAGVATVRFKIRLESINVINRQEDDRDEPYLLFRWSERRGVGGNYRKPGGYFKVKPGVSRLDELVFDRYMQGDNTMVIAIREHDPWPNFDDILGGVEAVAHMNGTMTWRARTQTSVLEVGPRHAVIRFTGADTDYRVTFRWEAQAV